MKELHLHYKIGLLTNNYKGCFEKLQMNDCIPYVNPMYIINSCDVGWAKPEKEIYLLAQRRAHVLPQEILYIDNVEKYLDIAKTLSWQTVLFDENDIRKSIKNVTKPLKISISVINKT